MRPARLTPVPHADVATLLDASQRMFDSGRPLMRRMIPDGEAVRIWDRYPPRDVVNGRRGARYFYHCHPPEARGGEHGHFHLFVDRAAVPGTALFVPPADAPPPLSEVVHIAALAIDAQGLPIRWFTVNRWVTGEWMYRAPALVPLLPDYDLDGPDGDPLVNAFLGAMVRLSVPVLAALLVERDRVIAQAGFDAEARSLEILSSVTVDLGQLLD